MGRKKEYKASTVADAPQLEELDSEVLCIPLPRNPRGYRQIDHRRFVGLGVDAWIVASTSVMRSLLKGGNFTVSSIIGLSSNGLQRFIPFLQSGILTIVPSAPSMISGSDILRYIAWLKLKYPNGSTAKNYYSALKSLLVGLIDYGFITSTADDLLPSNPFPMNSDNAKAAGTLSSTEMQRLISALKKDLVAIHKGTFSGSSAEPMTVLLLTTAIRSGSNTTPLLEMTRDALQPHPFMPNLRLIKTVKRRGRGAQSRVVRQTNLIDMHSSISLDGVAVLRKAISMSEALSDIAPPELRDLVWLYRSGHRGGFEKIVALSNESLSRSTIAISERHDLKADDGTPLTVTLSRLRKTMESRLWKLSGGDLIEVASAMGHTPQVADNHYLHLDDATKAEGAIFIGQAFTNKLRGLNIVATPLGGCSDSLFGALAPKDGASHCFEFSHCLGCPNYAIVGTVEDLYRLFSYQLFLRIEAEHYPTEEWAGWRDRNKHLIDLIDKFTSENFNAELISQAKTKAQTSPHPFWARKRDHIARMSTV